MKGLRQTLYSLLTAICCVLSYTDGMPSPQPQQQPSSTEFHPSRTQCCKVGESFAKKQLACEFGTKFEVGRNGTHSGTSGAAKLRFVNRRLNAKYNTEQIMASAFIRKLTIKADQCTDANLISYTTKCCSYRQRYYRELKRCNTYTDVHKKKPCRDEVRQAYP